MATPDLISLFGQDPQLIQQARDIQMAQLSPEQRMFTMGAQAGRSVGQGLGSLFGVEVQDPLVQKATALRSLAKEFDTTTPDGLMQFAQAASKIDPRAGALAAQQAQAMMKTQSEIAKNLRERAAADPFQKLVETGKYTPASLAKYKQSGDVKDLEATEKPETKSEFERILGSLDLSPEQEKSLKQQWVQAKLNPDPSGMKAMQVTLAGLQAQQLQDKITTEREKKTEEKKTAIQKLSDTESSLDTALNAADKALKLAPGSFAGASSQALLSSIPWTDAKSLNNLVSTLQSEKVMGTLEQLKSQSRTGATGFGSLTEKELTLLMNRITSLDPTDKMFKQNLSTVMEEWKKVQQKVRNSRRELQGGVPVTNAEELINRTIEFNKSKGNMSRDAAIQLLKSSGKLPSDY